MMFYQHRVDMAIKLRAGSAGLRILSVGRVFPLLKDVRTFSGSQPASYTAGAGVLSRMQSDRGMKLTIHLHAVPRLRMSGSDLHNTIYFHGVDRGIYTFIFLYHNKQLPTNN